MSDVRADCEAVAREARWVSIDADAIGRWAEGVNPASIVPAPRPPELLVTGTPAEVANWTLLLDSLNFCFWSAGQPEWTVEYCGKLWRRYTAMAAGVHRAVTADRSWLNAERWRDATLADVGYLFAGTGRIPMLEDRVRILNETGDVLMRDWKGQGERIAGAAELHACRIAELLAQHFVSFRDIADYRGRQVAILKRAQIFAANLAEAWDRVGGPVIGGLEKLTAFADYRIPQALRHLAVLRLERQLANRIESKQLIPAGSAQEVELRACAVHAVELMTRAIRERHGAAIPAWKLDEYLWHHSHDPEVSVEHHRTVTWFY